VKICERVILTKNWWHSFWRAQLRRDKGRGEKDMGRIAKSKGVSAALGRRGGNKEEEKHTCHQETRHGPLRGILRHRARRSR